MEFLREHQMDIMMVLSGICGNLAFFVYINKILSVRRKIALMSMELGAMFLLMADRCNYLYRGSADTTGYRMVRISNFMVFFLTVFMIFTFNLYLKDLYADEGEMEQMPKRLKIVDFLCVLGAALVIYSQFTGLYYYFDESNLYHRGGGFYICYLIPAVIWVLQLSVILQYRSFDRKIRLSLIIFSVFPMIASVAQSYIEGISFTNMTLAGVVILIYIFALFRMNESMERARQLEINILKEEKKNSRMIFEQTAQALASAIDAKDKYTHGHSMRVAEYSRKIAEEAGKNEKECEEIYFAALLHDVGKIGIPDRIINKEGKLTAEEFSKVKDHPAIGQKILSSIGRLPYLSIGAHFHHERYDGTGYPEGLKGEDIPAIARIIAVADAYDAMTSKRSYRDPLAQQRVREEIVEGMESQFDPVYAGIMVRLIDADTKYLMKEREEGRQSGWKSEVNCNEYRSDYSEGVLLTDRPVKIVFRCRELNALSGERRKGRADIVLYDALDGRLHTDENKQQEMSYYEYGTIGLDGQIGLEGVRKTQIRESGERRRAGSASGNEVRSCELEAVKVGDHLKLRLSENGFITEIIAALPDGVRYAYAALTGEFCNVWIDRIEKEETPVEEGTIPRIAPKINFAEGPEGDLPNLQIDGWRTASTKGIPVVNGMKVSFHAKSLPMARLVWHCPFITLFHADEGLVGGRNFREYALMRLDGECWQMCEGVQKKTQVSKLESFENWTDWKKRNKEGYDCEIEIRREGSRMVFCMEDCGIFIRNIISVTADTDEIYMALTGDQCAITNIRIQLPGTEAKTMTDVG